MTPADIAIYGGAAGGGKTVGLLLEPLRHALRVPGFSAVIFRRNLVQVRNSGGLWDESTKIYGAIPGAKPNQQPLGWRFYKGGNVRFAHLEHDDTVRDFQGAQINLIGFDELTHFCCTPETDVLTENGWKPIADVRVGERVASLANDRSICLSPVLETPAFDYDGELITLFQEKGISFRVTPNHRVVVDRQDEEGSWRFIRASYLEQTIQKIPRTGNWIDGREQGWVEFSRGSGRGIGQNANETDRCKCDDYLELLGWFLSEGSSYVAGKSQGASSPCVSIRQTKPAPTLDALIERLPWRACKDGEGGWRIFSRQLFDHLNPMGDAYTKRVPRWVFELSARQQRIVLDAFLLGDGSAKTSGANSLALCNEGLVDDIQEMAFYCGFISTKGYQLIRDKFHAYRLSISRPQRTSTTVSKGDTKRELYTGKVHCLRVQGTNNFLMRHRGRISWTGNSQSQFWYMLSRNRSTCGIRPYVRATTNPDADSWVAQLIAWWIDQDTGLPIPERSGVLRWFIRMSDVLVWGDSAEELVAQYPDAVPKSLTFIAAKLTDNKILLDLDPGYRANLLALPLVDRERLLGGNWLVRPAAGMYFQRDWCTFIDKAPSGMKIARGWDLAATPKTATNDPDWTCGNKLGKTADGKWVVLDHVFIRGTPEQVERLVLDTAKEDGKNVIQSIPRDPGQAGKAQALTFTSKLAGYRIVTTPEPRSKTQDSAKVSRFGPFSSQCEARNVMILRGPWNDRFCAQLEAFPAGKHDDDADAVSRAFAQLISPAQPHRRAFVNIMAR